MKKNKFKIINKILLIISSFIIIFNFVSCVKTNFIPQLSVLELEDLEVKNTGDRLTYTFTPIINFKTLNDSKVLYYNWLLPGTEPISFSATQIKSLTYTFPSPGKQQVTLQLIYDNLESSITKTLTIKARKAFLIYLAADNNLSDTPISGLTTNEDFDSTSAITILEDFLAKIINRKNILATDEAIVCFIDNKENTEKSKILTILKNKEYSIDLNELDSGNAGTLYFFLNWVKDNIPAEEYSLVIWGHGLGAIPISQPFISMSKAIAFDETSNSAMNTMDIKRSILDSIGKVKFLILDACLMNGIEVIYNLQGAAQYLVAAGGLLDGTGMPTYKYMEYILTSDDDNQIIQNMVTDFEEDYRGFANPTSLLITKLDDKETFNACIDTLRDAFASVDTDTEKQNLFNILNAVSNETTVSYELTKPTTDYPDYFAFLDLRTVLNSVDAVCGTSFLSSFETTFDKLVVGKYLNPQTDQNNLGVNIVYKATLEVNSATTEIDKLYSMQPLAVYTGWSKLLKHE